MAKKGLENFGATLRALEQYLSTPITEDRDKAGIIQGFRFTFEQCWKALQQHSQAQGVTLASPKAAFSFAMQSGLISTSDEPLWLRMLEDRNLTTHTYKQELADQVLARIRDQYVIAFKSLISKL